MKDVCRKTILVVDDDHDMRASLTMLLDDEGYTCVGAANGAAALHKLRAGGVQPCVILLDIMMPVMDGFQFRAAQLADEMLRSIPVLVLTAHAHAEAAAAEMKASAFLKKPVELDRLLEAITSCCPYRNLI